MLNVVQGQERPYKDIFRRYEMDQRWPKYIIPQYHAWYDHVVPDFNKYHLEIISSDKRELVAISKKGNNRLILSHTQQKKTKSEQQEYKTNFRYKKNSREYLSCRRFRF